MEVGVLPTKTTLLNGPLDRRGTAAAPLDTLERVWDEFDAVYARATADGDISQQVRMLLGRAEALRRAELRQQGCTGHTSTSLVFQRWGQLREMQLAVTESAIRVGDLSGLTSRISQAWQLMMERYRVEDEEGLAG